MTEQCHSDSCDVHNILSQYIRTGILEHVAKFDGKYGDFIDVPTFQDAQNRIAEAASMFETVPAKVRARFGHDPNKFIDWITDERNRQDILDSGFTDKHLPKIKAADDGSAPETSIEGSGGDTAAVARPRQGKSQTSSKPPAKSGNPASGE